MHAIHLPGARRKRFWQKKWPREVLFNGPPIIVAGSAAVKSWQEPVFDPWTFGLATTVCLWLAAAACVRVAGARAEDRKDGPEVVHEGLYAAVSTMHTMLSEWCNKRQCGADIRATFHRVVPPVHEPRELEQIINYAGATGEGVGRTFPVHTGITGRAIRSKKPPGDVQPGRNGRTASYRTGARVGLHGGRSSQARPWPLFGNGGACPGPFWTAPDRRDLLGFK
ncbi:hypothetical protein ACOTCL_22810 [Achromobacter xylosoxidans]